jgi:phage gp46-like protein
MTIGISWNNQLSRGELTINHDGLSRDEGMVTLVLICLFTDVRADTDDIIPDNSSDPRGWPVTPSVIIRGGQNSGYWTAKN